MRKSTKITAALGGAALTVATAGAAYAYWTTTGGGTGSASTTNGGAVISVVGSAGAVAPGAPDQAITGTVSNTGTAAGYVNTVTASVVDTTNAACDATNFSIVGDPASVAKDLATSGAASSSSFSGQALHFVNKADTAQDACKNVTVHLSFSSN